MAENKKAHVSKEKIEAVKKLASEIKNKKSIILVSIKSLPSAQFQKIKKDLRGKALIQVAKKSILLRALDETKVPEIEKLKEFVKEDMAVLTSDDDAFQIAGLLTENKSAVSAKEGQIAENDITVEEGPTELVPGPVISELGALGLQIMVEDGKITIRKSKVATKKGEKVTSAAASIFQKLGIKPFFVGIEPLALYDSHAKKVFSNIKIDKKQALENLISAKAKALAFAVSRAYPSKETIGFLLAKANSHFNALNKLKKETTQA